MVVRSCRALVILLAAFVGFPAVATAQEATPTPDVPPADICEVEAPTFDRLNAIVLTPLADATPLPPYTSDVVPAGTPADPPTIDGVVATVRELVGCYNAGELLRSYGLYTEPYLHRLFNRQGGFSREAYDNLATPEPGGEAGSATRILDIRDVRLLDNGFAGATVTLGYASIPMPKTFFFTFEWNGERWLIADILGEITFSVP
jgi:hypothetical protein